MFKDLRSPEAKRQAEIEWEERRRENDRLEQELADLIKSIWPDAPWQPIDTCPFEMLSKTYGMEGTIFLSDGQEIAMATVSRRFGRPLRVVKPPEYVMTDDGPAWIGGEYEEIDAPDWWFEWELTDVNGNMNYAGGEEIGKDEVEFIPTMWLPLPLTLNSKKAGHPEG